MSAETAVVPDPDAPLRVRARELGVQTSWFDVHHDVHHADDVTLERIIDVLEADRAAVWSTPRLAPALHLDASRPITVPARVERATIGDRLLDVRHGDGRSLIDLPADLPFGCHTVMIDTDRGAAACVVVVAPTDMPRSAEFAGTAGLFVPTYALWEADNPLPSFRHLHDLARAMKSSGIDVVSTLPLYATFLDDPFDPSPYSPISRLHWNEVFLDDDGLPEPADADPHRPGRLANARGAAPRATPGSDAAARRGPARPPCDVRCRAPRRCRLRAVPRRS